MRILSIETSCDDTGIALVEARGGLTRPHFKILKNLVSSQIKIHRPYGGVVPNLAKREHIKNLPRILQKFKIKNLKSVLPVGERGRLAGELKIDAIAVTVGPGLEPALWTGIEFAKNLAKQMRKSLIGVNHLEGHLYSFLLKQKIWKSNVRGQLSNVFPAICLIVSGGHTILLKMDSLTKWKKLGETRDDAAGEAFDKVARMLNLPYPGGPELEKLAKKGNSAAINFPRPMLKDKNYDFSFSGLKTSVLYFLRDFYSTSVDVFEETQSLFSSQTSDFSQNKIKFPDIAASFQQAVIEALIGKIMRAVKEFKAKSVMLSGGVAANRALRKNLELRTKNSELNFFVPSFELNTDNAAMIAGAAYVQHLRKKNLKISAQPNLNL